MWLRDFLSKDLPNCRTMIYGYNSKLSSFGNDTIIDYGREFLEGIKRIRNTQKARISLALEVLLLMWANLSSERGLSFSLRIALEVSYWLM